MLGVELWRWTVSVTCVSCEKVNNSELERDAVRAAGCAIGRIVFTQINKNQSYDTMYDNPALCLARSL